MEIIRELNNYLISEILQEKESSSSYSKKKKKVCYGRVKQTIHCTEGTMGKFVGTQAEHTEIGRTLFLL